MKAGNLRTIAPGGTGVSPVLQPDRTARLQSLAGVALLVGIVCCVGRSGMAQSESGTTYRGSGAGLRIDVDTRWLSGPGYRPVRITITPVAPVIADRTLTVEFSTRRHGDYQRDALRVVQDIDIPAGSGVIQTTMSIPQTAGWSQYTMTVLEDGKANLRLSHGGAGDQYASWAWDEKFPKVLFVADKLPDTTGMAGLLNVSEYYQYQSGVLPSRGKMPLPTAIAKPAADLPQRWIDYTNLDLICLSAEELAGLAAKRPETLRAILDWTLAGGNLCVYGVQRDWSRLPELESLVGLPPGTADAAGDPQARGWTEPNERLLGRPIGGVGPSVTTPRLVEDRYEGIPDETQTDTSPGLVDTLRRVIERRSRFQFVFRRLNMGMIVALADEDPFADPVSWGSTGWSWVLNSIGSRRFIWYQRYGMSGVRENRDFWNLLISGVGLAPVTGFRVLITLFVLAIGPLNYLLLRRWKSLHLLVVTVPCSAAAVTLVLFAYAMVADGLGTRVRVRSFTRIDQRRGHAACWARLSFYAGLAPFGGLRFPDDVAVIPLEHLPGEKHARTRELIWEGEEGQWLSSGWLLARTPTQLITVRSRPTDLGLAITEPEADPNVLRVENRLGTPIRQLLVRTQDGRYFWATDVQAGVAADAGAIAPGDARPWLERTFRECQPRFPVGMDRRGRTRSYGWGYRRSMSWMFNQVNVPGPSQGTGLLETSLGSVRSGTLEPGSYAAVVDRSPEVVLGTSSAREEASLHVILGRW